MSISTSSYWMGRNRNDLFVLCRSKWIIKWRTKKSYGISKVIFRYPIFWSTLNGSEWKKVVFILTKSIVFYLLYFIAEKLNRKTRHDVGFENIHNFVVIHSNHFLNGLNQQFIFGIFFRRIFLSLQLSPILFSQITNFSKLFWHTI